MPPLPNKEKPRFSYSREAFRDYFTYTLKGLALAWRTSPGLGALILALTALSAALPPAMAYAGKLIVDAVVQRNTERAASFVALEFMLIAASTITQRVLFLARTLLGNQLGIRVNYDLLAKSASLALTQMENSEFYDQLSRARMEASSRSLQMVTDTFQFLQNFLTLLAYVTLLFSFSGWVVLALLLASLPATFAEMRFSNIGFKLYNWRSPERRQLSYMEYVLANDGHAKELRIFGLAARFLARYRALSERFYAEDRDLSRRRTFWVILLSLVSSAAFYGCYLVIALAAARGAITLGNLTLYVTVFRQGQQAFQSCLGAIGGTYEHTLYLSNLFGFLAIPPLAEPSARSPLAEPSARSPLAEPSTRSPGNEALPAGAREGIYFDHLSFRYPGREALALEDITLHIPRGRSVAVVGSNGAGKSTLIKLLCRLYQPTAGRILLDGRDLNDWDHGSLLARLSVVFQDFNRYQLTLRENVGVGELAYGDDEAHLHRAIERGGAADLLPELPRGLDTFLGNWFSGGRELSGGQWQKVAVSRGFMREEADILILDEPTAALDAEAEANAFAAFQALTRGKTSFIISHRFPVARLADQIVVIEGGRLREVGSHAELIAAGGRYSELFRLQAAGYA